jgi:serine phosphatase RsbU (regulator of sigma subunit)
LNSIIPESFIFFKPKDIVSGDFYWFTEIENKIYIAAVDCTGHGVPGGFMSMLGMSYLNEIAGFIKLKTKNYTAADILFKLRKLVIRSLNQTGFVYNAQNIVNSDHIVKDGMDIAFCIIDTETNSLNFAGANNPLYIVKKSKVESKKLESKELSTSDFQLYELKGDKMPIGAYTDNEKPFTNHFIKVEKDSSFYIFTDGFADQFGGDEGKKYKYNKLKELLLTMQDKPMNMQRKLLQNNFENWINTPSRKYDQVDDVLIIGFKI